MKKCECNFPLFKLSLWFYLNNDIVLSITDPSFEVKGTILGEVGVKALLVRNEKK